LHGSTEDSRNAWQVPAKKRSRRIARAGLPVFQFACLSTGAQSSIVSTETQGGLEARLTLPAIA